LTSGLIFDIHKYAIHDGPGIRTTVFLKGCPLKCWWCHNPESQSSCIQIIYRQERCIRCGSCLETCPQGALQEKQNVITLDERLCDICGDCVKICYADARQLVGKEMSTSQVMAEIISDIPFFDQSGGGVTFSGGEPLFQSDFLLSLLQACKEQDIHTVLDTCGFSSWETLELIRPWVDLFYYDLKMIDAKEHYIFTGVSNQNILVNLQRLSQHGHHIILRLPILPGINDDEKSIFKVGAFAASLPHLDRVDILPYHRIGLDKYDRLNIPYKLPDLPQPSDDKINAVAQILSEFGLTVNNNHSGV